MKICPPYITLLQRTKNVKIIKQNFSVLLSDQYKIMMTDCRILCRNEEALPNIKRVYLGKKNGSYVENDKFPKIGDYPLNAKYSYTKYSTYAHMYVCKNQM